MSRSHFAEDDVDVGATGTENDGSDYSWDRLSFSSEVRSMSSSFEVISNDDLSSAPSGLISWESSPANRRRLAWLESTSSSPSWRLGDDHSLNDTTETSNHHRIPKENFSRCLKHDMNDPDDGDGTLCDLVEGQLRLKLRRAMYFTHPNVLCGKRRRRRCPCSSCYEQSSFTRLERIENPDTPPFSFLSSRLKKHHDSRDKNKLFVMTAIDFGGSHLSLNKHKRWATARPLLESEAMMVARGVPPSQYDRAARTCAVFDVEIVALGVSNRVDRPPAASQEDASIVLTRREEQDVLLQRSLRLKDDLTKAWRMFKGEEHYYRFRSQRPFRGSFTRFDVLDIATAVRVLRIPPVPPLDGDRETYIQFKASMGSSRRTMSGGLTQQPLTHMSYPMIHEANIAHELQSAIRSSGVVSYGGSSSSALSGTVYTSSVNHMHCWAPTATTTTDGDELDSKYEDWCMDIDFTSMTNVVALVIQGRSPVLEPFPQQSSFASEAEWKNYSGPVYPVAHVGQGKDEFVRQVEISAKAQRKEWFSLGVFKANNNALTPVRIDLPMLRGISVRSLRVRPLSLARGGFVGRRPAFKIAVVGSKQRSDHDVACNSHNKATSVERVHSLQNYDQARTVPKGFVRYVLTAPKSIIDEQQSLQTDEEVTEDDDPPKLSSRARTNQASQHNKTSAYTTNPHLSNGRYSRFWWRNGYERFRAETKRLNREEIIRGKEVYDDLVSGRVWMNSEGDGVDDGGWK